jgi:uncharacterized membrane-anchored protein
MREEVTMPRYTAALAALGLGLCLCLGWAPAAGAQEQEQEQAAPPELAWQVGPLLAPVGDDLAEIELPQGFVFLDAKGTAQFMELTGNPVNGSELATVAPAEGARWFLVFEWDEIGWVDDTERDSLDAEALLASLKEGTEAANEERRKRGWPAFELVGWREAPHYDERTQNLTWAIEGRSENEVVLNRLVKVLGRRGVMSVTLVGSPEDVAAATPTVDGLLGGYRFRTGNTYAEYLPGTDRVAQVGLAALVVGGGAAALAKSGLLAKFWKPIAVGAVALLAGVRRFFGRKQA